MPSFNLVLKEKKIKDSHTHVYNFIALLANFFQIFLIPKSLLKSPFLVRADQLTGNTYFFVMPKSGICQLIFSDFILEYYLAIFKGVLYFQT